MEGVRDWREVRQRQRPLPNTTQRRHENETDKERHQAEGRLGGLTPAARGSHPGGTGVSPPVNLLGGHPQTPHSPTPQLLYSPFPIPRFLFVFYVFFVAFQTGARCLTRMPLT